MASAGLFSLFQQRFVAQLQRPCHVALYRLRCHAQLPRNQRMGDVFNLSQPEYFKAFGGHAQHGHFDRRNHLLLLEMGFRIAARRIQFQLAQVSHGVGGPESAFAQFGQRQVACNGIEQGLAHGRCIAKLCSISPQKSLLRDLGSLVCVAQQASHIALQHFVVLTVEFCQFHGFGTGL